ncbi:septum formation protein [Cetobacterium ceti]|uniref:dTTP/UTP pyrophosphatase n=1 Tax=Cetobacterium ceti TaxID=180163 RepID=A0A1T4KLL8_9FUSO|nr:Maf family protein [Cetobacterium ceti]SJZ43290.1 septum formation protein [Cetobacterium ceti]
MILASKSPRRKEILEKFDFNLKIITKEIEEVSDRSGVIDKILDISRKKVMAVAMDYKNEFVVGADTVVELDGEILGKPKDKEMAFQMLKKLSGRKHRVITAYWIVNIEKEIQISNYDITDVYFHQLKDDEIEWYINTGEPMDKAGAYGIQDKGSLFVEKIDGDFFTVMGFPIGKFVKDLNKMGISLNKIKSI